MAEAITTTASLCLTCPVSMENMLIWPTSLAGITVIWTGIIFKWLPAADCSDNPLLSLNPEDSGKERRGFKKWLLL